MHLKMSPAKWRPSGFGPNVLTNPPCGKVAAALQTIPRQYFFLKENTWIFYEGPLNIILRLFIIGHDNDMAPHGQQAIVQTNDDHAPRLICISRPLRVKHTAKSLV